MHILVKDNPHHGGLGLVDGQIVKLVFLFVETSALDKIIAIWGDTALEPAVLDDLAEGGFCAD